MYESFWGLSSKPFTSRHAIDHCVPSQSQRTALLRLNYAFDNSGEAAVVVGSSGLGKSTVIRLMQAEHQEQRLVVPIVFPSLSPVELLRVIADEVNPGHSASLRAASPDVLLMSIRSSLRQLAEERRRAVICFDDAHLLSPNALTQTVQPLLNLADTESRLQLCVVLAGQPVLVARLARQAQLNERVGVLATLQGFSANETRDYVQTQLKSAGCSTDIFTDAALQCLFELSHGNPRRVNRLSDMALLVGCAAGRTQVTDREVEAVATELLPVAA